MKKINITQKEKKVLMLFAKGLKRDKVASLLGSSRDAIDFHCRNLFKKFNTNKLSDVLEMAKKEKIFN